MPKKIIFFELNEVPVKVFDFYADSHPNSAFSTLKRLGRKFETKTEDFGELSPWITWPSLHRGVANTKHEISDLGQNISLVNKDYPPIWELLARQGVKVGVFGSLHSYPLPDNIENYAFYVPDTFAAGVECHPPQLESFQAFNLDMVASSGRNISAAIKLKSATKFLLNAPSLGVQTRTVKAIAEQLANEAVNKNKVVRRRTSQVQIAFDLYLKALNQQQPDISFFFTNHLASSMHRYWPALFPEDYETLRFDKEWIQQWQNEIPFALKEANFQLQQLINFVNSHSDYQLIVASSMGQAAVQKADIMKNQVLITNINKLMNFLNIENSAWEPHLAMQPRQVITVKTVQAEQNLLKLQRLRLNGEPMIINSLGSGDYSLKIEMFNLDKLVIELDGNVIDHQEIGIELTDLQDAAGSNAYHIPEGILISYKKPKFEPAGVTYQELWAEISALEVAPSLLKHFEIEQPSYMKESFTL